LFFTGYSRARRSVFTVLSSLKRKENREVPKEEREWSFEISTFEPVDRF
jgi:hypothetical protein